MAIEITVPRLGWSMDEGTFTQWLKQEGEWVRKGDMLFVLEGDKAAQEIESFDEGTLYCVPNGPKPGEVVQVGQLLGYLLAKGEQPPSASGSTAAGPVTTGTTAPGTTAPGGTAGAATTTGTSVTAAASETPDGVVSPISSPRARRRAMELGVDWQAIQGTGRNGRVRERDVLAAASDGLGGQVRSGNLPVASGGLSATRRTIAQRMVASHQQTAPVTLVTTVDATQLVTVRSFLKSMLSDHVPSYGDIILKACAVALRKHPRMNARWESENLLEQSDIHIGVAVDTEDGLLAPVLQHADRLTLNEIAKRSKELVEKARGRRLSADELRGGTFTITNLGAMGIDAFTPVINLPQCAILGIGRIARVPVVRNDQVVPGDQLTLSLTFDHRIVDGAPAARFLQEIARLLENPKELS